MGRYRVVRRLARGGTADVLLACEVGGEHAGRLVVLKRPLEELEDAEEFLALFAHEARLATGLVHPNIVRVLDAGSEGGVPFLAMEWLDGMDARMLLDGARARGERLDPAAACLIAAGAARGLDHAHGLADAAGVPLEIVHRDVSPENLFITAEGGVKILDFGIAKARGRLIETRSGLARGKLPYLAPEQLTGGVVDARTDVFSLGAVLWEMLTGRRVWGRSSDDDTARAIKEESAHPPSLDVPGLPPELDALVLAMLTKFPRTRPRRALDVVSPLEAAARSLGVVAEPAGAIARLVARYVPQAPEEALHP